jgi:hypothetical protein
MDQKKVSPKSIYSNASLSTASNNSTKNSPYSEKFEMVLDLGNGQFEHMCENSRNYKQNYSETMMERWR